MTLDQLADISGVIANSAAVLGMIGAAFGAHSAWNRYQADRLFQTELALLSASERYAVSFEKIAEIHQQLSSQNVISMDRSTWARFASIFVVHSQHQRAVQAVYHDYLDKISNGHKNLTGESSLWKVLADQLKDDPNRKLIIDDLTRFEEARRSAGV
ncbi:hypothetical protein [Maricaulis maris]|uniref:hypothetical protein n=1 Tax=Maricaulis maris TaxID=74318 RepID=UPI003A933D8B